MMGVMRAVFRLLIMSGFEKRHFNVQDENVQQATRPALKDGGQDYGVGHFGFVVIFQYKWGMKSWPGIPWLELCVHLNGCLPPPSSIRQHSYP